MKFVHNLIFVLVFYQIHSIKGTADELEDVKNRIKKDLKELLTLQNIKNADDNLVDAMKDRIKAQMKELMSPVETMVQNLKHALDNVNDKRAYLEAQKKELMSDLETVSDECLTEDIKNELSSFFKFNFDSCVDFSDNLKEGSELFAKGFSLSLRMAEDLAKFVEDITNCPAVNPLTAFKCFKNVLGNVKLNIKRYKTESVPFVRSSAHVLQEIRISFDNCVGIPYTGLNTNLQRITFCEKSLLNE